jgi:N-dimethylarginine dimethylaminohydrolase
MITRISLPRHVLMCSPDYFDVVDVKNPHMEGQVGNLDTQLAFSQWEQLKACYKSLETLGVIEGIHVIPPTPGAEDMVFCANQTFPFRNRNDELIIVLSNMRHASRRIEVPAFHAFFSKLGAKCIPAPQGMLFEGMGDAIPLPGKRKVFLGTGFRTSAGFSSWFSDVLESEVVELELLSPDFYHLDTCFIPISESLALWYPPAFSEHSARILRTHFDTLHAVKAETAYGFGLNAHFLSSETFETPQLIVQSGLDEMRDLSNLYGWTLHEVETSEFMKSGGSVFCMKVMF